MKTQRVNEESVEGNYVIEIFINEKWQYITTEFSASVATIVMVNLSNATKKQCRLLSRRSNNMIIAKS